MEDTINMTMTAEDKAIDQGNFEKALWWKWFRAVEINVGLID